MSFFEKNRRQKPGSLKKPPFSQHLHLTMKRSILLKDTHFHDFPFILPVIIFICRINTAFPSSST